MPWSLSGARAASMHLVKVRGERARPNGRTRYWNASPPKTNLRNFLWEGMMETWKYASFRSIVTNQSSDLIWLTMIGIVSILNLNLLRERFKCRRSKIGRNPPSFLGTTKYRLQNPDSLCGGGTRSMASFTNREWTSCSITRPCSGCTTVQTTPLNFGGGNRTAVCTPFLLYAGPMEIYSEGIAMRRYNLLRESASRGWPRVFFEYRLRSPEAENTGRKRSKTIFCVRTLSLPGRKPLGRTLQRAFTGNWCGPKHTGRRNTNIDFLRVPRWKRPRSLHPVGGNPQRPCES